MLNLTWLLVLYVPLESSFVWTQYFVLNLDGWYCLTNFPFFDTPLLYYCISVRSLPISFFWRHISLFRYFLSSSIFFVSNLSLNYVVIKTWNFCNFISDFITSKTPVASANFWIALFEAVSSAYVWSRLFSLIKSFIYYQCFGHIFSKRQKPITNFKYSISGFNWIAHYFLYILL